jgi:predicted nucleic acid-binding protein
MPFMSGGKRRFTIDTNLLVYSVDNTAGWRHRAAIEIVDRATECDCCLTLQALSEFYSVVTRKAMVPPAEAAAQALNWLAAFECVAASPTAVRSALTDATSARASYWDALLVATAREAECSVMLTEDLADGTDFGGVQIHNPFSSAGGLTPLARQLLGMDQPRAG